MRLGCVQRSSSIMLDGMHDACKLTMQTDCQCLSLPQLLKSSVVNPC